MTVKFLSVLDQASQEGFRLISTKKGLKVENLCSFRFVKSKRLSVFLGRFWEKFTDLSGSKKEAAAIKASNYALDKVFNSPNTSVEEIRGTVNSLLLFKTSHSLKLSTQAKRSLQKSIDEGIEVLANKVSGYVNDQTTNAEDASIALERFLNFRNRMSIRNGLSVEAAPSCQKVIEKGLYALIEKIAFLQPEDIKSKDYLVDFLIRFSNKAKASGVLVEPYLQDLAYFLGQKRRSVIDGFSAEVIEELHEIVNDVLENEVTIDPSIVSCNLQKILAYRKSMEDTIKAFDENPNLSLEEIKRLKEVVESNAVELDEIEESLFYLICEYESKASELTYRRSMKDTIEAFDEPDGIESNKVTGKYCNGKKISEAYRQGYEDAKSEM